MTITRPRLLSIILCTLALGVALGVFAERSVEDRDVVDLYQVRQNSSEYTYINPLLECEARSGDTTAEVSFIENEIGAKVDTIAKDNELARVAVYFRDLNNGPWFGINYDAEFSPASLVKVPVLLSILKMAEQDPNLLDRRATTSVEADAIVRSQNIQGDAHVYPGREYSVRELLEYMIVHSDNAAMDALQSFTNDEIIAEIFNQVGVPITVRDKDLQLSVRQYASFFRLLYNASYLNRSSSEQALSLMARSSYDKGIAAGVPKDVSVAHKFGERGNPDAAVRYQLHDCGIVYHRQTPYLLCIMTQGNDFPRMERAIREMSRLFYEEVDKTYRKN